MNDLGMKYAARFASHHDVLRDLLGKLSEEQARFTLWSGSMTVLEIIDHLSHTHQIVMNDLRGEAKVAPTRSASLAEARARFDRVTAEGTDMFRQLTSDDLNRVIEPFPGVHMTVERVLDLLADHDAHHKGQLWVAARHLGLTPPLFVNLAVLAQPPTS